MAARNGGMVEHQAGEAPIFMTLLLVGCPRPPDIAASFVCLTGRSVEHGFYFIEN